MEVTTKQQCDATKWFGVVPDILQAAIQSLYSMTVLHWSFIIDDDVGLIDNLCEISMLFDPAG